MYYLQSRYYDPAIGRFVNADSYACTGQGLIGHNTFAYCGNSPISRIDTLGDSWVAVLGAVGVQYASDVFGNIVDGKIGWDIFIPTSSLATYTAVAVTSLIPGGNLVSAAVRSTVSESIIWVDNVLRGESKENNVKQSLSNIITNTFSDFGTGRLMDRTFGQMGSKDFANYAKSKVSNNTMTNLQKTYTTLQRSNTIGRTIGKIATKLFETFVSFFTR